MTSIKLNRIARLSESSRYPLTFRARLDAIPPALLDALTAAQIAVIIDGPMQRSYTAGYEAGHGDSK